MNTFSRKLLLVLVTSLLMSCGLVTSPEEKMAAASASVEDGDYRAAVIQLRNVLVDNPDNIEARLALAKVMIDLADLPTAEKELQRAIDLGAAPLEIERVHLSLLAAKGDYPEVLAALASDDIALPDAEQLEQLRSLGYVQ